MKHLPLIIAGALLALSFGVLDEAHQGEGLQVQAAGFLGPQLATKTLLGQARPSAVGLSSGNFVPPAASTYTLGSSSRTWSTVYADSYGLGGVSGASKGMDQSGANLRFNVGAGFDMVFQNSSGGEYFRLNLVEARTGSGTYLSTGISGAGAPTAGDCDNNAERGRLYIDTTNNRLYVCNGATRAWDYAALTD